MSKGRKIAHYNDHPRLRRFIASSLAVSPEHSHRVVDEATNLPRALQSLEDIHNGNLGANVIFLGNLADRPDGHSDRTDGRNVRALVARMHELNLGVVILGMGRRPMAEYGVKVDIDLPKADFDIQMLEQILNALEETDA